MEHATAAAERFAREWRSSEAVQGFVIIVPLMASDSIPMASHGLLGRFD